MKNFYLLLLASVLILSCGTRKDMSHKSTLGSIEHTQDISYFAPIYSFEDQESSKSRRGRHLVKYTNHAADSIFQAESEIFRISNKIRPSDSEVSQRLIFELDSIFNQVQEKQSIDNLKIPPVVDSVSKKDSQRYSMAILVSPEMDKKGSGFKSIVYHLLIFDLESGQIAFYGSSSDHKKKGYVERYIHNIKEIYGVKI